jgi:fatty acid-binding protein DegV
MLIGGISKIHPVIEVRVDGTFGVIRKVMAPGKKLFPLWAKTSHAISTKLIIAGFIIHTLTDVTFADANFIRSEIEKLVAVDDILFTTAGETIARHCGTETVGMLYLIK